MAISNTYQAISTTTLTSAQSSYAFSSIPSTYTDLVLITQHTCATGSNNQLVLRPNSDSSALYSRTLLTGDGTSASSARYPGEDGVYVSYVGNNTDLTISTNYFLNYSNTTTYKSVLTRSNAANIPRAEVTLWRSTSAISSLLVLPYSGTFATGSTFTLYGISSA